MFKSLVVFVAMIFSAIVSAASIPVENVSFNEINFSMDWSSLNSRGYDCTVSRCYKGDMDVTFEHNRMKTIVNKVRYSSNLDCAKMIDGINDSIYKRYLTEQNYNPIGIERPDPTQTSRTINSSVGKITMNVVCKSGDPSNNISTITTEMYFTDLPVHVFAASLK
jgi:hypothetical protein